MPLYDYFCLDCRQRFEALRKMADADQPIRCERCEGANTTRTLSLIAAPVRASGGDGASLGGGGCCGGSCGCRH